jgi:hypothetical protein
MIAAIIVIAATTTKRLIAAAQAAPILDTAQGYHGPLDERKKFEESSATQN